MLSLDPMPASHTLRVAVFSVTPGARYRSDGPYSGQEFREDILCPAYDEAKAVDAKLTIDLDDTQGYAPSFLEEAFGGLAREVEDAEDVLSRLEFKSDDDPKLVDEIRGYIRDTR